MKSIYKTIWLLLLISVILNACSTTKIVYVKKTPPQKIVEIQTQRPSANVIWIEGHWLWHPYQHKYIWVKGHWKKVYRRKIWVKGYWGKTRYGWVWNTGHWMK